MPSYELNEVFNRALFDKAFCAGLFADLARVLEHAQVPKTEIEELLERKPGTLEQFAQYMADQ